VWVHVSIMHCSFELSQVTLPFVLLRPPPVGRPRKRPRRDGEKGEQDRKEEKKEKEKRRGKSKTEEETQGKGTEAGRKLELVESVAGEGASERHIHCPPPTKPSFFAEVARSRWTGRSSGGSDGNRRRPTIFCIRGAADSTAAAAAAAAMATAAGATVHRCQ